MKFVRATASSLSLSLSFSLSLFVGIISVITVWRTSRQVALKAGINIEPKGETFPAISLNSRGDISLARGRGDRKNPPRCGQLQRATYLVEPSFLPSALAARQSPPRARKTRAERGLSNENCAPRGIIPRVTRFCIWPFAVIVHPGHWFVSLLRCNYGRGKSQEERETLACRGLRGIELFQSSVNK